MRGFGAVKGPITFFAASARHAAGMATATQSEPSAGHNKEMPGKRVKLHGRAFYESIGSPKIVLAPMVEQSEFVSLRHALPALERTSDD